VLEQISKMDESSALLSGLVASRDTPAVPLATAAPEQVRPQIDSTQGGSISCEHQKSFTGQMDDGVVPRAEGLNTSSAPTTTEAKHAAGGERPGSVQVSSSDSESSSDGSSVSSNDSEADSESNNGSNDTSGAAGKSKQWSIKVTMKGKELGNSPVPGTAEGFGAEAQTGENNGSESKATSEKPKRKKRDGNSANKQKSYPDMIVETLLESRDKKGTSIQSLKKLIKERYKVQSSRFAKHMSMAVKKLISLGKLEKTGARYKLEAKLHAKKRVTLLNKKRAAKEAEFKRRLKEGLVTEEELRERQQAAEEEAKRKEAKAQRMKERAEERALAQDKVKDLKEAKPEKKNLPIPAKPTDDLPYRECAHGILSIAEFCAEHAQVLKLEPFTVDMLYNALRADHVTSLLREIHLVLLALSLEPEMKQDETVTRWDWFKTLNSLTWQEILRRYLVRSVSLLGTDYISFKLLQQACEHLSTKSYVSLSLETKVAIICVLVDDVTLHPEIVEAIDGMLKKRDELEKNKNDELRQDWAEARLLKASKKHLDQGLFPPKSVPEMKKPGRKKATDRRDKVQKSEKDKDSESGGGENEDVDKKSNDEENEENENEEIEDDEGDEGIDRADEESKDDMEEKAGQGKKKKKKSSSGSGKGSNKAKPSKEQLASLKQENMERLKEVEARKDRNAAKYDDLLMTYRLRPEPWGVDSLGNAFYTFLGDPRRLYVYGHGLRGEEPAPKKVWRYYNTAAQVDSLIKSMDPQSKREQSLCAVLKRQYDAIVLQFTPALSDDPVPVSKTNGEATPGDQDVKMEVSNSLTTEERDSVDSENNSNDEAGSGEDEERNQTSSAANRSRPTRGAAVLAKGRLKDQAQMGKYNKGGRAAESEKQASEADEEDKDKEELTDSDTISEESEVHKPTRPKTWQNDEPDAFEKYQNLLNYVEGLELDLDNPTSEQEEAGLDDPDVKLFKGAERMSVAARVLRKDIVELSEFLTERGGGFKNDAGLKGFQARVEKVLLDSQRDQVPDTSSVKQEDGSEGLNDDNVAFPVASQKELGVICQELERVATEAIIASRERNVTRELERKEKLRIAQEKKKAALKANKSSKAALEREQRNAWRQAKAQNSKVSKRKGKRKMRASTRKSSKRVRARDEGYTSSGRATRRVNYNLDDLCASSDDESGSSMSQSDTDTENDTGGEHNDEDENVDAQAKAKDEEGDMIAEVGAVDDESKAGDEGDEGDNFKLHKKVQNVVNEDIDVPKEEAERIEILQRFENLFPEGSEVRCLTEQGEVVNGEVKSYKPASFLTSELVDDIWTVELANGTSVELNEDAINEAADRLERYERDLARYGPSETTIDETKDIKETLPNSDAAKAEPTTEEEPDRDAQLNVRVLWGTKSERDAWFLSCDLAKTCASWAAVFYQLANRIYVNNSLKEDED